MHIYFRSGVDFGAGLFTLALGAALLGASVIGPRAASTYLWAPISVGLGVAVMVVVAAFVIRVLIASEYVVRGPGVGLIAVLIGSLLAVGGGATEKRRSTLRRSLH